MDRIDELNPRVVELNLLTDMKIKKKGYTPWKGCIGFIEEVAKRLDTTLIRRLANTHYNHNAKAPHSNRTTKPRLDQHRSPPKNDISNRALLANVPSTLDCPRMASGWQDLERTEKGVTLESPMTTYMAP
jgi:hypothetical protein